MRTPTKMLLSLMAAFLISAIGALPALAGAPLTNFEGVGGVALNPLAYVANPIAEGKTGLGGSDIVSMPNVGIWHLGLTNATEGGDNDIDVNAVGANLTLLNRIELGYSHQFVDIEFASAGPGSVDADLDSLSLKVNVIQENQFLPGIMPAISVGVIHKSLSESLKGADTVGQDLYAVATKTLGYLPVPVILNAGVLSTNGVVRGILGFGEDREEAFFGNIEAVLMGQFVVGWEYQQEIEVGEDLDTHSMWEAHVAWMHKGLTLIGSYIDTGDEEGWGLGDGFVLSAQYAF